MDNERNNILLEWNEEICGGQIVIHNTRIMIDIIFDMISNGDSDTEILENYPTIPLDLLKRIRWIFYYCRGISSKSSDQIE